MSSIPSAEEQKREIESELMKPIGESCFLISKSWWDALWKYIASKPGKAGKLGPINNLPLVSLGIDYESYLATASSIEESYKIDNWKKMSLKKDIKEDADYVLVSQTAWNLLRHWYSGGPEIRLQLVGHMEKTLKYHDGQPDLSPITLELNVDIGPKNTYTTGILVSSKATSVQLKQLIAEKFDMPISQLLIKHRSAKTKRDSFLASRTETLEEMGILDHTALTLSTPSGDMSNYIKEPKVAAKKEKAQEWYDAEDQDLQRALLESRAMYDNSYPHPHPHPHLHPHPPEEEKQKETPNIRERIRMICNSAPKTFARKKVTFAAQQTGFKTPLKHFAEHVGLSSKTPEQLSTEFDRLFQLSEIALKEKRISLKHKKKLKAIDDSLKRLLESSQGAKPIQAAANPI